MQQFMTINEIYKVHATVYGSTKIHKNKTYNLINLRIFHTEIVS